MHLQISKKIVIYLFVYFMLVTINNINFLKFDLLKIKNLEIYGLNKSENEKLKQEIKYLQNKSIFFLNKSKILNSINSNEIIEEFIVFKKYPSSLNIEIKKADYLAITKKNQLDYYIGSNGNLIKYDNSLKDLPYVFGDVDTQNFLMIKKIIDSTNLNFYEIKNLYFYKSQRWDIEMKNGLVIKLPLESVKSSLDILDKLKKKEEFKKIKVIDFRQNKQIVINE